MMFNCSHPNNLLLCILLFFQATYAIGQTPSQYITRAEAREDLAVFATTLKEIHPNIYRYTSKSHFDYAFDSIGHSLQDSVSIDALNSFVAMTVAMVRCGHTYLIPARANEDLMLLPIQVKIINNRIYVVQNFSSNRALAPGSEIVEINGQSAAALLQSLIRKSPGDGFANNFRIRTIERDFSWKYATLVGQPANFTITISNDQWQRTVHVPGMLSNKLIQRQSEADPIGERPLAFLVEDDGETAILKLRSFMSKSIKKQHGQKLKRTIREAFSTIRKTNVQNLIIDIRGNTGGKADLPPYLFSYLAGDDFQFNKEIQFRHGYRNFTYRQHLNRSKFSDWINRILTKKVNDSTYQWTHHRTTRKNYRGRKNHFDGNLYVIMNGMTASAGAEFASLCHVNKRGILVGEESGGDYNGVNGFDRTFLVLPHSKIGVLIPGWHTIKWWNDPAWFGRGVPPHHAVAPTIEGILNGTDEEMEFVHELILKK